MDNGQETIGSTTESTPRKPSLKASTGNVYCCSIGESRTRQNDALKHSTPGAESTRLLSEEEAEWNYFKSAQWQALSFPTAKTSSNKPPGLQMEPVSSLPVQITLSAPSSSRPTSSTTPCPKPSLHIQPNSIPHQSTASPPTHTSTSPTPTQPSTSAPPTPSPPAS